MANNLLSDYDGFWDFASDKAYEKNDMYYHDCCDVWTTRKSKFARESHAEQTTWRSILQSLQVKKDDRKAALLAKMTEEGWRIPVELNKLCTAKGRKARTTKDAESLASNDNSPASRKNVQSSCFLEAQNKDKKPSLPTGIKQTESAQPLIQSIDPLRPMEVTSCQTFSVPPSVSRE